jgi:predicted nucleic-acid-binding Zn-ribbon protein
MKRGRCPKCDSSEVYRKTRGPLEEGVSISLWAAATLDTYICTNCGYVENYAVDDGNFAKIVKKWRKVLAPRLEHAEDGQV